jgi:nitrogen regulatory protein PII 1
MVAIHDEERENIIDVILKTARTGEDGTFGDGKIFITPLEEVYTISRGGRGL